jgi:flagellar basal-body rod protein FlgG
MYKGIYIAASGAVLMQSQLEAISQNISNANTSGYKKDTLSFKDHLLQSGASIEPDGRTMSDYASSRTDLSNGTIVRTGNSLDIAVEGSGFIALEGDRYTRRGDLKKSNEGYLTTHDGIKVLGSGGPIALPEDATEVSIDLEGKVSVVQPGSTLPTEIDTIRIVDANPDSPAIKTPDGFFSVPGGGTTSTATIKQGYLETSNVDSVREMVRMIETMREFESYQKAIQMFDGATSKVTNELGRF